MSSDTGVRFVRINGRVVPIRSKNGPSQGKVPKMQKAEGPSKGKVASAALGFGIAGAGYSAMGGMFYEGITASRGKGYQGKAGKIRAALAKQREKIAKTSEKPFKMSLDKMRVGKESNVYSLNGLRSQKKVHGYKQASITKFRKFMPKSPTGKAALIGGTIGLAAGVLSAHLLHRNKKPRPGGQ